MTEALFSAMALSFQGTEQKPHFNRMSFKVSQRRAFATYLATNNTANIFLTRKEQTVFCEFDSINIYPVPNKWGEKGATTFNLDKLSEEIVLEALTSAYNNIFKQKK